MCKLSVVVHRCASSTINVRVVPSCSAAIVLICLRMTYVHLVLEITKQLSINSNLILTGTMNLFGRHLVCKGQLRRISSTDIYVKINNEGLYKFVDQDGDDNTHVGSQVRDKTSWVGTKHVSFFVETDSPDSDSSSGSSSDSSEDENEPLQAVEQVKINIGTLGLLAAFSVQGSWMDSYGGGTLPYVVSVFLKGVGEDYSTHRNYTISVSHLLQEGKSLDPIKTDEYGYYVNQRLTDMIMARMFENVKGTSDNFNHLFREARIGIKLGRGNFHPDKDENYRRKEAGKEDWSWRTGAKKRNEQRLDGNLPTKQVR